MPDPITRLNTALEGRYRVERELGEGGMATVYLADDLKHDRKVAVKVLKPDLAASIGPERFLQEVRITAHLQHPHILALFDSGEADGFLFYVMPYVDGESLKDRLTREGELPVADAARILRDVVDALSAAHAAGVIHRDIKPANILLSGRHAMVADFGVAKAVSEAKSDNMMTTVGTSLGTPAYMSPEQAAADETIDHRTDVYAVGAMAYELLTGRPPFTASTHRQVLMSHITQAPKPVTEHRPSVPAPLAAAIMRCLEKNRADRWQRIDELLPYLDAAKTSSQGMTPVGMPPVTASAVSAGWMKRLVPVALVLGAVGVWQWPGPGSSVSTDDPVGASDAVAGEEGVRLAILPPENQSGDPEWSFVAAQLEDEMRSSIARHAPGIEVLQRGATEGATHALSSRVTGGDSDVVIGLDVLRASSGEVVRSLERIRGAADSLELLSQEVENAAAVAALALEFGGEFSLRYRSLARSPEAQRLMQSAQAAFGYSRYADAIDDAFQALTLEPEYPGPYPWLWFALATMGRLDEWPDSAYELAAPSMTAYERLDMQQTSYASSPAELIAATEEQFRITGGGEATGFKLALNALTGNRLTLAVEGLEAQDFDHPLLRTFRPMWTTATLVHHLLGQYPAELARARHGLERFSTRLDRPGDHPIGQAAQEVRALIGLDSIDAAIAAFDRLREWPVARGTLAGLMMQSALEFRRHGYAQESERAFDAVLEFVEQNADLGLGVRARANYEGGRFEVAVPLLVEQLSGSSGMARMQPAALLVMSLERLGRLDEAAEYEWILTDFDPAESHPARRWPAVVAASRGDGPEATRLLREAFNAGVRYYHPANVDHLLHERPEFEAVRDDPAFQRLMEPR